MGAPSRAGRGPGAGSGGKAQPFATGMPPAAGLALHRQEPRDETVSRPRDEDVTEASRPAGRPRRIQPRDARQASLPLLVAVTMTGTVALHIFVPALAAAAADLGTTPVAAQLTITLYLVGLACGQLVYGPLSDRFGRRPVLIAGLSLYLAGLLLAIPARSIEVLIVARILQSLGACGSLVLGRAMVRDVSTATDAARKIAILTMAMTLTPALARRSAASSPGPSAGGRCSWCWPPWWRPWGRSWS